MNDCWQPVSYCPCEAVAIFNYNVAGIQDNTAKDEQVSFTISLLGSSLKTWLVNHSENMVFGLGFEYPLLFYCLICRLDVL